MKFKFFLVLLVSLLVSACNNDDFGAGMKFVAAKNKYERGRILEMSDQAKAYEEYKKMLTDLAYITDNYPKSMIALDIEAGKPVFDNMNIPAIEKMMVDMMASYSYDEEPALFVLKLNKEYKFIRTRELVPLVQENYIDQKGFESVENVLKLIPQDDRDEFLVNLAKEYISGGDFDNTMKIIDLIEVVNVREDLANRLITAFVKAKKAERLLELDPYFTQEASKQLLSLLHRIFTTDGEEFQKTVNDLFAINDEVLKGYGCSRAVLLLIMAGELEKAEKLASGSNVAERKSYSMYQLAAAYASKGDGNRAVELIDNFTDPLFQISGYITIAERFLKLEKKEKAAATAYKSLEMLKSGKYVKDNKSGFVGDMLINLMTVFVETDKSKAFETADYYISLIEDTKTDWNIEKSFEVAIRILLAKGEYDKALEMAGELKTDNVRDSILIKIVYEFVDKKEYAEAYKICSTVKDIRQRLEGYWSMGSGIYCTDKDLYEKWYNTFYPQFAAYSEGSSESEYKYLSDKKNLSASVMVKAAEVTCPASFENDDNLLNAVALVASESYKYGIFKEYSDAAYIYFKAGKMEEFNKLIAADAKVRAMILMRLAPVIYKDNQAMYDSVLDNVAGYEIDEKSMLTFLMPAVNDSDYASVSKVLARMSEPAIIDEIFNRVTVANAKKITIDDFEILEQSIKTIDNKLYQISFFNIVKADNYDLANIFAKKYYDKIGSVLMGMFGEIYAEKGECKKAVNVLKELKQPSERLRFSFNILKECVAEPDISKNILDAVAGK